MWHYDDGGGNWADAVFPGERRAVLVGHDHEYSTKYFRESAAYFGEPETDLLEGCPRWWEPAIAAYLDRQRTHGVWIGFIYGFGDGHWSRADYSLDDGFTSLDLPFLTAQTTATALVDLISTWSADLHLHLHLDPPADVDVHVHTLIESGRQVTAPALSRALGPVSPHVDIPRALAFTRGA